MTSPERSHPPMLCVLGNSQDVRPALIGQFTYFVAMDNIQLKHQYLMRITHIQKKGGITIYWEPEMTK